MISVDFDKSHWIKVWNKASSECSLYNLSSLSRDSSFYLQVITLPVSIATGISGKPHICGLGGGGGKLDKLAAFGPGFFGWWPEVIFQLVWVVHFLLHEGRMEGRRECRSKGWGWVGDSAGGRGWGLGRRLEEEEVKQSLASILESWQASASSCFRR